MKRFLELNFLVFVVVSCSSRQIANSTKTSSVNSLPNEDPSQQVVCESENDAPKSYLAIDKITNQIALKDDLKSEAIVTIENAEVVDNSCPIVSSLRGEMLSLPGFESLWTIDVVQCGINTATVTLDTESKESRFHCQ